MCGECAGCLWARERYAMSALRCFITSKAKLKKIKKHKRSAGTSRRMVAALRRSLLARG